MPVSRCLCQGVATFIVFYFVFLHFKNEIQVFMARSYLQVHVLEHTTVTAPVEKIVGFPSFEITTEEINYSLRKY